MLQPFFFNRSLAWFPRTAQFALIAMLALVGHAESRRAILVGINEYNPDAATKSRLLGSAKGETLQRAKVDGDASYWRFNNLEGALNDVALMKGLLQSFGVNDFVVLENQQATAEAILSALKKNLVDDAAAGDVRIFYYSGHGNHIKNTSSKEHGEDQTIVPADNWRNIPDVRDKEISRILWQAAKKGVKVTFIADSCHSGSLSRGAWNARGRSRTNSGVRAGTPGVALREPVVNDPADVDPATKKPIDPEALGILTLAAAQQNEEALEVETDQGPHGAFTWALSQALKSEKEPMERVFAKTLATMRSQSLAQQPIMGGLGRANRGIFGGEADPNAGITVIVEPVTNPKDIKIRGGVALGIYQGCTLKSFAKPAVELEVTGSIGLSESTVKVLGAGTVRGGDVFLLDKWSAPPKTSLRVYMPNPAPAAMLYKVAAEVSKLRTDKSVTWLEDPTEGKPTYVMSWNGSAWLLEQNPAAAAPVNLGADPTAAAVKSHLPANAKFLMLLPPTTELATAIHLGDGNNNAIDLRGGGKKPGIPSPAGADYWFYGRVNGADLEYAWLLPDSTEASVRELAGASKGPRAAGYTPLPLRTDWIKLDRTKEAIQQAGATLTDKALRLAKVRAWFALESPGSQGSFPYHLALKNVATGQLRNSGDLKDAEEYKLFLRADPNDLKKPDSLSPRWVYIFAIDHFGKSTLIFPQLGRGNDSNHLPYAQHGDKIQFPPLFAVNGDSTFDFNVSEPFGVDSYFLLTSEDPIDNPGVLDADGVRTGASRGAGGNPLSDLLAGVGSASRGVGTPAPAPARWSIESLTLRSLPKN